MKKISLVLAFVAALATVSHAGTNASNDAVVENAMVSIFQKENVTFKTAAVDDDVLKEYTCTVTATWINENGNESSVTVTVKCGDCTSQQSTCDKAYKIASIVIPD